MDISVKWQPETRASSHEKLAMLPAIGRLAEMGARRITCRAPQSGRIYQFYREGHDWEEMPGELDISQIDLPSDGAITKMVIETQYRDASNYKNNFKQVFEGVLKHSDFNTLLTALFMDFDGIIPHQLMMKDHQDGFTHGGVDFENEDHPWHEIWGFEFEEPDGGSNTIPLLIAACEERIKEGWDSIAAMQFLQDAHDQ